MAEMAGQVTKDQIIGIKDTVAELEKGEVLTDAQHEAVKAAAGAAADAAGVALDAAEVAKEAADGALAATEGAERATERTVAATERTETVRVAAETAARNAATAAATANAALGLVNNATAAAQAATQAANDSAGSVTEALEEIRQQTTEATNAARDAATDARDAAGAARAAGLAAAAGAAEARAAAEEAKGATEAAEEATGRANDVIGDMVRLKEQTDVVIADANHTMSGFKSDEERLKEMLREFVVSQEKQEEAANSLLERIKAIYGLNLKELDEELLLEIKEIPGWVNDPCCKNKLSVYELMNMLIRKMKRMIAATNGQNEYLRENVKEIERVVNKALDDVVNVQIVDGSVGLAKLDDDTKEMFAGAVKAAEDAAEDANDSAERSAMEAETATKRAVWSTAKAEEAATSAGDARDLLARIRSEIADMQEMETTDPAMVAKLAALEEKVEAVDTYLNREVVLTKEEYEKLQEEGRIESEKRYYIVEE